MAIKALNSIGGFSVGENPSNVILANGDITSNNANFTGNLDTNKIRTDTYQYANGVAITFGANPGGANTYIQFNNGAGGFGGTANLTFDSSTNLLTLNNGNANISNLAVSGDFSGNTANFTGNVVLANANVTGELVGNTANFTGNVIIINANITGNLDANVGNFYSINSNTANFTGNITANYFHGNFEGNISGNFIVPGNNTAVLFNNDGNSGASDSLTFNKDSNTLTILGNANIGIVRSDTYQYANGDVLDFQQPAGSNTYIQYNSDNNFGASSNLTFNADTSQLTVGSGSGGSITGANSITANFFIGVFDTTSNSQPNITTIGTLSNLTVSGNANVGNILTDNYFYANGDPVNFTNPAGSNTEVQFNNGDSNFGSSANFTYDTSTDILTVVNLSATTANVTGNIDTGNLYVNYDANIVGNLIANALTIDGTIGTSNIDVTDLANIGNLHVNYDANIDGNLTANYANITANLIANNANITANLTANNALINGTANIGNLIIQTGGTITGDLVPSVNFGGNLGNATNAWKDLWLSGNTIQLGNLTLTSGDNNTLTTANANINTSFTANTANFSGNATFQQDVTITGNLVVGGNTAYVNVTDLSIKDPIIDLGGAANGGNASAYDGKDRGLILHNFYSNGAGLVNQFFGWKTGNNEFVAVANVDITNETITINSLANLRVNAIQGNLQGTILQANQTNITSVGTLVGLSISGTGNGNLSVANTANIGTLIASNLTYPSVDGNPNEMLVTYGNGTLHFANIVPTTIVSGNSNIVAIANSNITVGVAGTANVVVVTSTGANITGYANISGNVSANNVSVSTDITGYILSLIHI